MLKALKQTNYFSDERDGKEEGRDSPGSKAPLTNPLSPVCSLNASFSRLKSCFNASSSAAAIHSVTAVDCGTNY